MFIVRKTKSYQMKFLLRCKRQRMQGSLEGCYGQSMHHDSGGEVHGRGADRVRDHPQGGVQRY